jgi:hypothetical protein
MVSGVPQRGQTVKAKDLTLPHWGQNFFRRITEGRQSFTSLCRLLFPLGGLGLRDCKFDASVESEHPRKERMSSSEIWLWGGTGTTASDGECWIGIVIL